MEASTPKRRGRPRKSTSPTPPVVAEDQAPQTPAEIVPLETETITGGAVTDEIKFNGNRMKLEIELNLNIKLGCSGKLGLYFDTILITMNIGFKMILNKNSTKYRSILYWSFNYCRNDMYRKEFLKGPRPPPLTSIATQATSSPPLDMNADEPEVVEDDIKEIEKPDEPGYLICAA